MNEVELTSDLMILAMNGVTAKSKPQIDNYYANYDDNFPSSVEVASRIRDVFDTINVLYSQKDIGQFFSSVTMFYGMFASVYGLRYGLRSPVSKGFPVDLSREKPKAVEKSTAKHILDSARAISYRENVPAPVERALRGATADAGSRRLIIGFLAGSEDDPCPPQS